MGNPAARTTDMHVCPMVTGVVPHVGGPITAPCCPTVLIGGLPSARATDQAACVGPPDFIVVGSATVHIGGLMAAYMGSQTMHGGAVVQGYPTVLIGGPAAGATLGNPAGAAAVFPGQQNFGNCGVQSAQQIIHQATGNNIPENTLLNWAISHGYADNDPDPLNRGATTAGQIESILDNNGVPSHTESQNMHTIEQATAERRGVISGNDAGVLWNSSNPADYGAGHAVNVTGLQYDSNGHLQNVIINDTGSGNAAQSIPASRFNNSLLSGDSITTTDNPVW